MEPLNPIEHQVHPYRLLGWLEASLRSGRIVDVTEWNKAVEALQGTNDWA